MPTYSASNCLLTHNPNPDLRNIHKSCGFSPFCFPVRSLYKTDRCNGQPNRQMNKHKGKTSTIWNLLSFGHSQFPFHTLIFLLPSSPAISVCLKFDRFPSTVCTHRFTYLLNCVLHFVARVTTFFRSHVTQLVKSSPIFVFHM